MPSALRERLRVCCGAESHACAASARVYNESLSTYAPTFSFDAHVVFKLVWCWHPLREAAAIRGMLHAQRLVFITNMLHNYCSV